MEEVTDESRRADKGAAGSQGKEASPVKRKGTNGVAANGVAYEMDGVVVDKEQTTQAGARADASAEPGERRRVAALMRGIPAPD